MRCSDAPVFKGDVKISSVITMEQKMCEELQEIFEETEVEYRILSCRDSRCLVSFSDGVSWSII